LRLETHTARSTSRAVRAAGIASQLVLPLDQHAGQPAIPVVRPGDRVRRGQPIATTPADTGAWLHAPVAGTVRGIEPRQCAHHGGGHALCIVLDNDGSEQSHDAEPIGNFSALEPAWLCDHIARGGIVGLGGAVFPTAVKLAAARERSATHLLLNGAECEPWISCDDMLMREHADTVLRGAQILCHAVQAERCTVAIEDDMPDAAAALRSALATAADSRIQLALVPRIYPAGGERQLIATLTGREVPSGALPVDIGVICQNVATAAATARWICEGVPLISRIVTVTGSAVAEPANLEVRLGTAIVDLINECGGYRDTVQQLIMGGSMMGTTLPSDTVPVMKASNCIVAATAGDFTPRGREMPCIRCGSCAEVCPAILLPQQLHWFAQRPGGKADLMALADLGLMDCIECGCCDYVCPSHIPLTQRFRDNKALLAPALLSTAQAAQSRQHFETRNARLQRLEEQRRAQLEAKRKLLSGG
jgi:electron transport complex protein RnfC